MFSNSIYSFPEKSLLYSVPYLLLALVSFVLLCKGKKEYNKKFSYITLIIVHLVFWGLRWHIMSDTLAYEIEFDTINPVFSWKYIETHSWWWDKGFVLFTMIVKLINPSFAFFVFINSLVDILLFSLCLKKYSNYFLISILAFLAFQGILSEVNLLRNMKSILLFLLSIKDIENRRLISFLLINFVGYTFHSSALLFFPMYWILNRHYKFRFIIVISIFITAIYLLGLNPIEQFIIQYLDIYGGELKKLNTYITTYSDDIPLSIGTLERLLTLVLVMWTYYKSEKRSSQFTIFFNSFICFYILYALFGFNSVFRDRIPYLFIYSYWFIYPYIFVFFVSKKRGLKFAFYFLFFMKIYTSTNICSAYYENIMFKVTSRQQREYLIRKCTE